MRYILLCMFLLTGTVHAALEETDWLDLMPESDRQALFDMPEISHDTPEAESGFYVPGGLRSTDKDLPAVMYSAQTVPALDGRKILLGGYPVPLETNDKGNFVEFFLVPYPGACIHVPPPRHHHRPIKLFSCAILKVLICLISTRHSGLKARCVSK